MRILGIESSCDETAIAIVDDARTIHANIIRSQHDVHTPFGGVVPEIAARSHIEHIDHLIEDALNAAQMTFADVDGIAATTGPGLIGGVLVGTMTGKALASVLKKPFIAVNHLEGHALTVRLMQEVAFPYLLLLVSGGHCQVLAVESVGNYHKLGGTLDDALGEAYDKVAKLLGLGFPGGPAVEIAAKEGNPMRFTFPLPLKGREGCDFSFSGLKTAVRLVIDEVASNNIIAAQDVADICASFQYTIGEVLKDRLRHALSMFEQRYESTTLVVAGGVAANHYVRARLEEIVGEFGFRLVVPPPKLCTDNAAMIAWVGIERLQLGLTDPLTTEPRARWPLSEI